MPTLGNLLSKWPLLRQIRERKDGPGSRRCRIKRARCMRAPMARKWRDRFALLRRRLRSADLS